MSITLRMSDEEAELIKKMAELYGKSVSDYIRTTVFERIEDEFDLRVAEEALDEYEKDHVAYSFEEVNKMLGIEDEV